MTFRRQGYLELKQTVVWSQTTPVARSGGKTDKPTRGKPPPWDRSRCLHYRSETGENGVGDLSRDGGRLAGFDAQTPKVPTRARSPPSNAGT